ncbi:MAG: ribonuclease III [Oscillospiraceae bacterium]|nr:ribonuclease III [Oscillospiraceae bacterium]
MYYLNPELEEKEAGSLPSLALAHIGDAVFELMTRTMLSSRGKETANKLHKAAVKLVAAPAQAKAAEKLAPQLTEEELGVYKRGRNAKVNSVPKAASVKEYHEATGLEALFGWLYLRGERERLEELFRMAVEED